MKALLASPKIGLTNLWGPSRGRPNRLGRMGENRKSIVFFRTSSVLSSVLSGPNLRPNRSQNFGQKACNISVLQFGPRQDRTQDQTGSDFSEFVRSSPHLSTPLAHYHPTNSCGLVGIVGAIHRLLGSL